jgi:acyl-coenzyme A thioesterase PaaI-like protein
MMGDDAGTAGRADSVPEAGTAGSSQRGAHMSEDPFQARLRPFGQTCFGCGQDNPQGLRIRSFWEGEEAVCRWRPQPWHMAQPGIVNGGVIATLIDCHCASTASAAAYRAEGRPLGSEPALVYVTASLRVDYLKPTPMDAELELRARVRGEQGRRFTLDCSLFAAGQETARGEVVMVRVTRR